MSAKRKHLQRRILAVILAVLLGPPLLVLGLRTVQEDLFAAGTYALGRKIILLTKLESGGLMFESWEGKAFEASYSSEETCNDDKRECYTPTRKAFEVSIRPENGETVNFMRKNVGREMVVDYRIHRVEPAALSSNFEVLKVYGQSENPPANFVRRLVVEKTGSRNFDVYGRILSLSYRGTVIGTYEGLYYDISRKKVHAFSITNSRMASLARDTMFFRRPMHMGISDAIITGARSSNYDIYEINYDEESGGVPVEKPKAPAGKEAGP